MWYRRLIRALRPVLFCVSAPCSLRSSPPPTLRVYFLYDRATLNSTAMSIDTLRGLGWNIPRTGATSYLAALVAFPVVAVMQTSLVKGGREAFDFLTVEKTRFMPREAFTVGPWSTIRSTRLGQRRANSAIIWHPNEFPTQWALGIPTVSIQIAKELAVL
jgi:hypothetical protein